MRLSIRLLLIPLMSGGIYVVPACADDAASANDPNADVVYEGGATDEAIEALAKASVRESTSGPKLVDPIPGTFVHVRQVDPPVIFSWSGTTTGRRELAPGMSRDRSMGEMLFGGERVAKAHGAPLNGRAFLLVITAPTLPAPLRVFTTSSTYQPSAAVWSKLTGDRAGEITIGLRLTTGTFANDALAGEPLAVRGPTVSLKLQVQAR